MKIIFVCGGTSGHINPALNIANYIRNKDKNAKILFVGSNKGMECDLVKKEGFDFKGITVSGFARKLNISFIIKNVNSIKNLFVSSFQSRKILKEFKPDMCVGTGGYVTGAFLFQAFFMKIPFLIQEQNAIPGLTTKLLSRFAKYVLLGNDDAKKYIKSKNCIYTGNPIKNINIDLNKYQMREKLNVKSGVPVILSFGGSLGAKLINKVILDVMKTGKYFHIHSCGKNNREFYKLATNMNLQNVKIEEYIYDIEQFMILSDIVICRAGAMTLSELASIAKKAIIIPSPNVTNNHQLHNALSYAKRFNASVIEEKNLNKNTLIKEIDHLLKNNTKVAKKENKACKKVFDIILKLSSKLTL